MSIDADLKIRIITNEEVQIRRKELGQRAESIIWFIRWCHRNLIKRDAIAGIVIIFVNLIGGISVGMAQMGVIYYRGITYIYTFNDRGWISCTNSCFTYLY